MSFEKGGTFRESFATFPCSRRRRICIYQPFACIANAATLDSYGLMILLGPSSSTARSSVQLRLNTRLVLRQRTVRVSSKHPRVRCSISITKRFLKCRRGFTNKCGTRREKCQNWFWVSMTSPSRKGIPTIPAFTTSRARRCWTCCPAASWMTCGHMPGGIRTS